ncbi:MAG: M36 family metallopeptidase [Gemmatimonadota bacterium]|nr:MAG: M36 family metallopeptidase [Gemmatimonadota bacterium]
MKPLEQGSFRVVPGRYYGSPKEVWGFRTVRGSGTPQTIAKQFIRANASLFALKGVLNTLRRERIICSLGAIHVIYQQYHRKLRVNRGYVTIHLDRDRRVYFAKNRAVPRSLLPELEKPRLSQEAAKEKAVSSVRGTKKNTKVLEVEKMWFPKRESLILAYRVRLHRLDPREEWVVHVDAETGQILRTTENLGRVSGTGAVFDPNPVVALGDHRRLLRDGRPVRRVPKAAYTTVVLEGLAGTGYLDGRRVTTQPTENRVCRPDHQFIFKSSERGFEEVMVYFHIDRAIRYLESMGYRGKQTIVRKPIEVNVNGTRKDSSWYSPGLKRLTFGTGGVDDAEDAETILHELGHAIQDAICPGFGQSAQAAAMGEGFGDYFAASFFADKKPEQYRTSIMTWDGITWDEIYDPPCVRRLDEKYTFESFDHGKWAEEHENGLIWSATLWDIREMLGRDVADRIIVESHFQLDGFTTFARGARAIVDADRNLFGGEHEGQLLEIFVWRGIGPV